jgi:hypothetical protein
LIDITSSLLGIFTWTAVCVNILFLFEIGRFYQEKSGRKSHYLLFLVPVGFFAIAALIYAFRPPLIFGVFWADLLRILAGLVLISGAYFLLKLMLGK